MRGRDTAKPRWRAHRRAVDPQPRAPGIDALEPRLLLSTIIVDSLDDAIAADGAVTLREAIHAANTDTAFNDAPAGSGADVITFDSDLFLAGPQTISLIGFEILISSDLTIIGPGRDMLTISAQGLSRVFRIDNGGAAAGQVAITDVTLANGSVNEHGGAVRSVEDLRLERVTVRNSVSIGPGPGDGFGAGVYQQSTGGATTALRIIDSEFLENTGQRGGGAYADGASLTVTGSAFTDNNANTDGGGLYHTGAGFVTIRDSAFTANDASDRGGGAFFDAASDAVLIEGATFTGNTADEAGALASLRAARVINSTFTDNQTTSKAAAVSFTAGHSVLRDSTLMNNSVTGPPDPIGGGTVHFAGGAADSLTITRTTIADNTINGRDGGGVYHAGGALTIRDSTISGNTITAFGHGGGIASVGPQLTIINTTISGNTAPVDGGGIHLPSTYSGALTLDHVTIAGNAANRGGGLFAGGGATNISNTLIGDNTGASSSPDVFGLVNINYSLVESTAGALLLGSNNVTGVDPNLGPLASNTGPTQTHLLLPGSAAIDAGDPSFDPGAFSPALSRDQRGFARLFDGGAGAAITDIGAVEVPGPGAPVTFGIADIRLFEDASATVIDLFAAFDDYEDADADLTFTIEQNTSPQLFDSVDIDGAAGTLTLDYAPDAYGASDLIVRATDSGGLFVETSISIGLLPTPDAPLAGDDAYEVDEDSVLVADAASGLLANDADPDGNITGVTNLTDPSHGELTWNLDGSFTYTPDPDFAGVDSFTYAADERIPSPDFAVFLTHEGWDATFDFIDQLLYYSNKDAGMIRVNDPRNVFQQYPVIVGAGTGTPTGVAIDPIARKFYWVDEEHDAVFRINLDRTGKEQLVDTSQPSGDSSPRAIELDLINGKMYWSDSTDASHASYIMRANLDGSQVEVVAELAVGSLPGEIAIDHVHKKLYWTEDAAGVIYRAELDGLHAHVALDAAAIGGTAGGVAVDPFNEKIYFSAEDGGGDVAIRRADLDGSNVIDVIPSGLESVFGLELDTLNGYLYIPQPTDSRIELESLDLTPPSDPATVIITVHPVNEIPTTTGIADLDIETSSPNTVIDLFAAFDDVEDADADLTFTVEDNTNPALFDAVSIDAVAGTLTLDYADGVTGIADITLRATDLEGGFVDTTCNVTVAEPGARVVSGSVWLDQDADGLIDPGASGEPGVEGAVVELIDTGPDGVVSGDDVFIGRRITDADGAYEFGLVEVGRYHINIRVPSIYTFTDQDQSGDDTIDSDVDATGAAASFDVDLLTPVVVDAGVVLQGDAPVFGWAFGVGSSGSSFVERGNGVAVDGSGNVFLVGALDDQGDVDPGPGQLLLDASRGNGFIAKYTSVGALIWARLVGGSGLDVDGAQDVIVDGDGNAYLVATSSGTSVTKFDPDGQVVWEQGLGGKGLRIALDSADNVYVAGWKPNPSNSSVRDIFAAKLENTGGVAWVRQVGNTTNDEALGLAVDGAGNVYTTGYFTNRVDFDPGAGVHILGDPIDGSPDIFFWKLDTNGDFVWAIFLDGTQNRAQIGVDIAVDEAGDVYAAGELHGTVDFDPGSGIVNLSSTGSLGSGAVDVWVLKLDSGGDFIWARSFGNTGDDVVHSLHVDGAGKVYTVGRFAGTVDFDPGSGERLLSTNGGAQDAFVSVLDRDGEFIWAGNLGGPSDDVLRREEGYGVTVADDGTIFVTGSFMNEGDFDPSPRVFNVTAPTTSTSDPFLLKLNPLMSIAGRAWSDENGDGIQDAGEPSLAGVTVQVFDSFDGVVANGNDLLLHAAETDTDGAYRYSSPIVSDYYVVFDQPAGITWTAQDRGGDDTTDSDPDAVFGVTSLITITPGGQALNVDAGFIAFAAAPQAMGDSYFTPKDQTLVVDATLGVLANDTDASPLTAVLIAAPMHGELTLNADGSFEFIPNAGYNGPDSFTYKAFNGDTASAETAVAVMVNEPPTTTGIGDVYVLADAAPTLIDLFAAFDDRDDPDTDLTFTVESNTNSALFDDVVIDPVDGTLELFYAPGQVGAGDITVRATDTGDMFVDATFSVIVLGALPAPVMAPEPPQTNGTQNTIAWEAVAGADEYLVEYDDDPAFGSPDGDSGWITSLSHTFTGLTVGQTYHYRVKARVNDPPGHASLTQTTQAEFEGNVLTDTVATAGGDVTLVDGVPAPALVDVVGGGVGSHNFADVVSTHAFLATADRTLTQFEEYLNITSSTALQFAVYENSTQTGSYQRIALNSIASSGTGERYFSSGDMSVSIIAGRYYIFAVAWQNGATYFYGNGSSPRDTDFGDLFSARILSNGYPVPTTMTAGAVFTPTLRRYTTTGGTGYAAAGTVVTQPIAPDPLHRWDALIFDTDAPAGTSLTVDVLPETGDTPIAGFEDVQSGADLSTLGDVTIRLRANLATSDVRKTPALHEWTVQWQAAGPVVFESAFSDAESSAQNGPPITLGLDDVEAGTAEEETVIDLAAAFDDDLDDDADLTFTVTEITNGALFDAVTVDDLTGELTLDFAAAFGVSDLTVRVTDTGGLFVETTFTVTVNDPPTTSGVADVNVDEDASDTVLDLFAAFADGQDSDAELVYSIEGVTDPSLFDSTDIELVGDTSASLVLDYAADAFGASDITVRATDTLGGLVETTFTVTVAAVNDPPTTTGIADIAVAEGAAPSVIDLFAAFADVEDADADLTYTVEGNSNPGLFDSVVIDGAAGTLTLAFAADTGGESDITIRATDSGGAFIEASFTVTVEPLGSIAGVVWNDLNGDGVRDVGEGGRSGVTVYLDLNENGAKDGGEPQQVTAGDGSYLFDGLASGSYIVAELVPGGTMQTFPGAAGSPVPQYKIDLIFGAGLTASQQTIIADAAARWMQIITGDLPNAVTDLGVVDDIAIDVRGVSIDGAGGAAAVAAPTQLRVGSSLPARGLLEFDTADVAALESSGELLPVAIHEIAHALGFGYIWQQLGLIINAGQSDPRFTGAAATAEYAALTGAAETSVPVANTGGFGTRDRHWREITFNHELMTGLFDPGDNPISRVTIASLEDLGYQVNYDASDPYTLPGAGGGSHGGQGSDVGGDPPLPFTHRVELEAGEDVAGVDFGNADLAAVVISPQLIGLSPAPGPPLTEPAFNLDLTFSEPVFGVDATDLVLGGAAGASATVGTPIDLGDTWRFPISGLGGGQLTVSLAPDAGDIQDSDGHDFEHLAWSYQVELGPPPVIEHVMLGGSGWSASFRAAVDAHDGVPDGGYTVPVGSADQLKTLPWIGLDTIGITFSEDVNIAADDLALFGVNSSPEATGFSYDAATFTATWTLPAPLTNDKLMLAVVDEVTDVDQGAALDGEWEDGVSTVSGDGGAGGDFVMRLNVLPGDATQNGLTAADDALSIIGKTISLAGSPTFSIFHDLSGNGLIAADDALAAIGRTISILPADEPVAVLEGTLQLPEPDVGIDTDQNAALIAALHDTDANSNAPPRNLAAFWQSVLQTEPVDLETR